MRNNRANQNYVDRMTESVQRLKNILDSNTNQVEIGGKTKDNQMNYSSINQVDYVI